MIDPVELQKKLHAEIREKIPEDKVVPRHNEKGHFYEIVGVSPKGKPYPSVTAKLQVLKDQSLMNYKMNRALDYVFANFAQFTDENVMDHLDKASKVSTEILYDAADIGTTIHDVREEYFSEWIKNWKKPERSPVEFIPEGVNDIRAISALNALDDFVKQWDYHPVITELFVWRPHTDKSEGLAGTLDDLGIIRNILNPTRQNLKCEHKFMPYRYGVSIEICKICGQKWQGYLFALSDLKTSNQFKDHYFFQVSMYYDMFVSLTGMKPDRNFILKLDKKDRTYKLEDLKYMNRLVSYANAMIKTNEALDFIKSLRKDNQRDVAKI